MAMGSYARVGASLAARGGTRGIKAGSGSCPANLMKAIPRGGFRAGAVGASALRATAGRTIRTYGR